MQPDQFHDASEDAPLKNVEKKSSSISFEHKVYDELSTFKMQPEIATKKHVKIDENDEKFETSKIENENDEPEEYESDVLRSRSYGVLANIVLKTVSEYSIKRQMPLDEIRKQISMAEMRQELSRDEVRLLETAVERIEKCEELKIINADNDKGLKVLVDYVSKLFDVLKAILFGDTFYLKSIQSLPEENEPDSSEKTLTPNETSIEQLPSNVIKEEEEESAADRLRRVLYGSHMQIRKEYENKLCACSKNEEPRVQQEENEIEIEDSDGILRTVRKGLKTAVSQESAINEVTKHSIQSFEEVLKTVRSRQSNNSVNNNYQKPLQKFKNEEDLTKVGLKSSQSFLTQPSDIEDTFSSMFGKYPKAAGSISVLSVPSIQANVYKKPFGSSYVSNKKTYEEDISNAVIQDLNDDGYINLV